MLVLITYDVNTADPAGRTRLRRIAKQCVNYGQRVQNSVFECLLDASQCRSLQNTLCKLIDPEKDSLRFYYLGNRYESKIEHFVRLSRRCSASAFDNVTFPVRSPIAQIFPAGSHRISPLIDSILMSGSALDRRQSSLKISNLACFHKNAQ